MKNRKQFAHRVDMWDDGVQVARQCRRAGSPGECDYFAPNARRAPRTLARNERLTGSGTRHGVSLTTDKLSIEQTLARWHPGAALPSFARGKEWS